ncbi:Hint domain-containing protein [Tropicimonas isoalkanivorans]|uniref:Hint domain-containing protein n=1 Tax=Tropicimonas isoalkanivorans TaxID=441112 RepID=A0A1I1D986_9RHOB|nr:Hint domain-containing protein [Tropicimonas isoalkanivorans]SFB70896.1 Hint domain-containing protein [Tropicimonas isoalkanivorans]
MIDPQQRTSTEAGRTPVPAWSSRVCCFTPGTIVATPAGERPVEDLKAGDAIVTRDHGIQKIRWHGRKDVSSALVAKAPQLQPVRIGAGALGNGLPERDMVVSPNHRMLLVGRQADPCLQDDEVLVAARHLVSASKGIGRLRAGGVSYIHFMCDKHEIVRADGVWTESFQPSDEAIKGLGSAQRTEIFEIFPNLRTSTGRAAYVAARKSPRASEVAVLH